MDQDVARRAIDILLRLIAEGTAPVVGEKFFRLLVRYRAEGVGVKLRIRRRAGMQSRALAFRDGVSFIRSGFAAF